MSTERIERVRTLNLVHIFPLVDDECLVAVVEPRDVPNPYEVHRNGAAMGEKTGRCVELT